MKKIYIVIPAFIITFLFISCLGKGKNEDYRTESALDLYQLEVPKYMTATSGLNQDASMQFQNIYKETYLAVIEEPKQDFIDTFKEIEDYDDSKSPAKNYETIQMNFFTDGMKVNRMGEPQNIKINGLDAQQVEFVGRVPDIDFDIFYLMTFIEGKETLYMMMTWTLSANENTYKETFKHMAESFEEL
ncbi:MAG: hypothetical protein R2786_08675 [Flavobacteriaceae bacterium]